MYKFPEGIMKIDYNETKKNAETLGDLFFAKWLLSKNPLKRFISRWWMNN